MSHNTGANRLIVHFNRGELSELLFSGGLSGGRPAKKRADASAHSGGPLPIADLVKNPCSHHDNMAVSVPRQPKLCNVASCRRATPGPVRRGFTGQRWNCLPGDWIALGGTPAARVCGNCYAVFTPRDSYTTLITWYTTRRHAATSRLILPNGNWSGWRPPEHALRPN